MENYISVDPGTKGGIALMLAGTPCEYTPMPDTAKGVRDTLEEYQMLAEFKVALVVEHQQPMAGKKNCPIVNVMATATMMRKYGQWEIFALMLGMPYHEVTPSGWKKRMGVTADKGTSIALCERLFPHVNLIMPGCRTKHDGVAEAILLAEDARRRNL